MHFKYIEAAAKMQHFKEVERVCRDSTVYEPEKVRESCAKSRGGGGGFWRRLVVSL